MLVAWQGGGKREVSVADTLSMGGVFLMQDQPLSVGTNVELIFDVPTGEVRARGVVRHGRAGRGMGLQFVHMVSEYRARLNRFVDHLKQQQRTETIPAPSSWFTLDGQPLDSGEVKSHHELFALLHKIYSVRMTGKLQLVFGRVEKQLFFDGGQLVFAASSDREDSLGEMMLRAGALTQSQFEAADDLVQTGQRFGSAICEMGLFSVDEIVGWVQRQLVQITASVLDYPSCRYYFFSSLEKNVVPEVGIPAPLGKLLLEAVRRAKDLPLEHLAADGELWIDISPDPVLRYQAVELNEGERKVLGSISGAIAAKELLGRNGLPKDAARALYALLVLGTVVCASKAVEAETRASEPAPQEREPEAARAAAADDAESRKQFEEEVRKLLEVGEKGSFYDLLGVTSTSTAEQVKESFHAMARKYHPDRHMGRSEWVGLLQDLMARLTTAYKTLVSEEKRAIYDKQLAAEGAFTLGTEKSEAEETVEDCLAQAKQYLRAHNFAGSILCLRKCVELAPDVAKYHAILARSLATVPQYRQDAVHHFKRAIELDQWNTSTYFQFGELYEVMRLPWRAVPLYRKILEIDPEHSKALERLGTLEEQEEAHRGERSFEFVSKLFHRKR
jgi:tetratricopeptide (TPR) repeat protein